MNENVILEIDIISYPFLEMQNKHVGMLFLLLSFKLLWLLQSLSRQYSV
jgi:hypothetical protein